jgi:hypothetical protein
MRQLRFGRLAAGRQSKRKTQSRNSWFVICDAYCVLNLLARGGGASDGLCAVGWLLGGFGPVRGYHGLRDLRSECSVGGL